MMVLLVRWEGGKVGSRTKGNDRGRAVLLYLSNHPIQPCVDARLTKYAFRYWLTIITGSRPSSRTISDTVELIQWVISGVRLLLVYQVIHRLVPSGPQFIVVNSTNDLQQGS